MKRTQDTNDNKLKENSLTQLINSIHFASTVMRCEAQQQSDWLTTNDKQWLFFTSFVAAPHSHRVYNKPMENDSKWYPNDWWEMNFVSIIRPNRNDDQSEKCDDHFNYMIGKPIFEIHSIENFMKSLYVC